MLFYVSDGFHRRGDYYRYLAEFTKDQPDDKNASSSLDAYKIAYKHALTALERHGVVVGLILTAARLAKCGPWHPGGWDPVPARWPRRMRVPGLPWPPTRVQDPRQKTTLPRSRSWVCTRRRLRSRRRRRSSARDAKSFQPAVSLRS